MSNSDRKLLFQAIVSLVGGVIVITLMTMSMQNHATPNHRQEVEGVAITNSYAWYDYWNSEKLVVDVSFTYQGNPFTGTALNVKDRKTIKAGDTVLVEIEVETSSAENTFQQNLILGDVRPANNKPHI